MLHIGCCGYTVAKTKYHEAFDIIELPQVFIQPPSPRVLASWRSGAPDGFQFVVKAWQLITHDPMSATYAKMTTPIPDYKRNNYGFFRPTHEVWKAWEATENAAEILGAKIIVFQCPPNFKPTEENVANVKAFFGKVRRNDYTLVFETRGGWSEAEVTQLCSELGLAHCSDPFRNAPYHGDIKYLRLQGKGGYNYRYTDDDMRTIIEKYRDDEAYVMFNNSNMFHDALRMKELCDGSAG
ncbi:MAG: DUF72 domain-containing protein [Nitrospirae bacterium]|nr:DUF72 domain-containing protein [Nitrospirota bacterium]MBI5696449.1 DUF72 domain-containing protein [Nitrospirota bacterium]